MTTTVHDVAAYILEQRGPLSAFKLQKLCYYAQAWHLAFYDRPLYMERIEAWANGPVSPDLYRQHRAKFTVSPRDLRCGDTTHIPADAKTHIEQVLKAYGDWAPHRLVELTHHEAPWRDARGNLPPLARSDARISHEAMTTFYRALSEDPDAELLAD